MNRPLSLFLSVLATTALLVGSAHAVVPYKLPQRRSLAARRWNSLAMSSLLPIFRTASSPRSEFFFTAITGIIRGRSPRKGKSTVQTGRYLSPGLTLTAAPSPPGQAVPRRLIFLPASPRGRGALRPHTTGQTYETFFNVGSPTASSQKPGHFVTRDTLSAARLIKEHEPSITYLNYSKFTPIFLVLTTCQEKCNKFPKLRDKPVVSG